jgi:hypothetical protein
MNPNIADTIEVGAPDQARMQAEQAVEGFALSAELRDEPVLRFADCSFPS